MSLPEARLIEEIEVQDRLGEGVLWRASDATLWWVDILGRRIHCMAWPSLRLATYETAERPGSLAFIEGRDDALIVAFETGFALWHAASGKVDWLWRLPEPRAGVRLNDGRAGPDGRFWAGSMTENGVAGGSMPPGALFRLDHDGRATPVVAGLHISNGVCWSPDGRRMYLADSARGEVYAADFDGVLGAPGRFATFATFTDEAPDGAVTDADGAYWVALWGGARVAALSPQGREIASVGVDAPQPSCPAFGGAAGNLLFVATARQGLTSAQLAAHPKSGNLFVYETQARGAPVARARLSRG